jgi:hypothetical protein
MEAQSPKELQTISCPNCPGGLIETSPGPGAKHSIFLIEYFQRSCVFNSFNSRSGPVSLEAFQ